MQKIRIFALAKELNMDSKDLIEACARVGIVVKSSALASISPEEKDKVLDFLKETSSSSVASTPVAKTVPVPPVREAVKTFDKPLQNLMTPRAQAPRLTPKQRAAAGQDESSGAAVATAEAPPETAVPPESEAYSTTIEDEVVSTTVTTSVEAVSAPSSESTTATSGTAKSGTAKSGTAKSVEEPPRLAGVDPAVAAPDEPEAVADEILQDADNAGSEPSAKKSDKASDSPLRRGDYIAPTGARRPVFNMKPQGTVDMSKAANEAVNAKKDPKDPKKRTGHSFAPLAQFKGATAAPLPPAQKPDMKLPTGTTINDVQPLQKLIQQHKVGGGVKKPGDDKVVPRKRGVLTLEEEIEQNKTKSKSGLKHGAGLEASRQARQSKRGKDLEGDDERGGSRFKPSRGKHKSFTAPIKTSAEIELPITIRSLSECIGRPAKDLLKIVFMRSPGGATNINSMIDEDLAIELALEVGVDLSIRRARDLEQELFEQAVPVADDEGAVSRPPIITILGHVDHGKTTLLDKIRSANVASGEAGGITQHIAAYQVEKDGHKLTFVDTPGHAAFTEMRARGANVTDIIVLVVAADDGVMPQTAEAISHAKAAGVPIIVALNKCDLPGRNEQKVLQELARHEIMPAEWGGDVEVVRTSGLSGLGIDSLLETLLLTAELHAYKSNPTAPASGVCLEAFRDEGRGTVTWLMVQQGTLKIGDMVVCGEAVGRVRNMYNDRGEAVTEAGPSTPIKMSGLDVVPSPGDKFVATADADAARQLADDRRIDERFKSLASKVKIHTLEELMSMSKGSEVRDLPLIIKADSPGSLEALRHELGKFEHPEVRVKVVHDGVGGVNESDVSLAGATGAIIIAFHVVPEDRARNQADREGVQIREYQIIYEVIDHIKLALEGLLKPELQQVSTGRALVLRTFFISRVGGMIAGCRVLNGTIERSNRVRVIRDHRVLNEYGIGSLKREKDDVKEVREGFECGIRLDNFNDLKEGDLFEAYRIEEVKRTLA